MPKIIGRLKSLKGLNFSHNNLTSYIPPSFGNLTNLEWLDLSFNKLIGEIPRQLTDIPWLAVLNLSHNQLTGHIPSGKQFDTFDNDSYIENLDLCGFPLSRTCNSLEAKKPPPLTLQQEDNLEPENGFGWQAVSMGYGCGVIFGMLMGYLMFKFGKPQCIKFYGPHTHKTPFFSKLVSIVAVEVIVRFKVVASNVLKPINNLFGQKVQDNATLDLEKCLAIIKVQILYEFKDRGSTLRDQNAIAVSRQRDITLLDVNGDVELPIFEFWKTSLRETLEAGLGVVLAFLSEKVTLPPLVDDIEALVAVRAISFALDLGFSSIILEEDLETIIKALRNNEESFASYGHPLSSAKSSIDAFSDISYSHIRSPPWKKFMTPQLAAPAIF
ncbi:hypothetical protein CMV_015854 [Castanea mollissima]|uniref:RNase H type-1 domain-containing protein n=1 Tax=Castanea mollissima TaxID=60419 RepID=A0A8J4R959_9ROSI|nr:hypothetical protein CMV_015854 [Castanea mollissima]